MYKNSVHNSHIDLIAKRRFISAAQMVTGQVTGASTSLTSGLTTGAPILVGLATSGIPAMRLEDVTDEIDFQFVPSDFDNRHPLYIRYLWTSDYAVANGTCTFTTLFRQLAIGNTANPPTAALTRVHAVSTKVSSVARTLYWSSYGVIAPIATGANANSTFSPSTVFLGFRCLAGAVSGITIATDFVYVVGAEIVYTPRLTFGSSDRQARNLADGLQPNLELGVLNDI